MEIVGPTLDNTDEDQTLFNILEMSLLQSQYARRELFFSLSLFFQSVHNTLLSCY